MTEANVRKQYDQLAAIYDQRWSRYVTNTLEFLQDWAALAPHEVVLDVACGTGEFERRVLAQHPTQQMVGIDISEQMLTVAQQKLQAFPQVTFHHGSATALPFADHSFDRVVSANAFHYFDDPVAALREMRRVLKPAGTVVILDWCRDFWVCRLCDALLKMVDPAHKQCYTQAEFHQLLSLAGFRLGPFRKIRFGWIWGLMVATASP